MAENPCAIISQPLAALLADRRVMMKSAAGHQTAAALP